jgi:hypothetical protein
VVAGLSVASVFNSPGVYWFVSVGFQWVLPGGVSVVFSIFSHLNFRTLYSIRQHIDVSFLVNVLKDKVSCSVMDTVDFRVPTRQIKDFSNFSVNNVSRLSPSSRCIKAAKNICKFLGFFNKHYFL